MSEYVSSAKSLERVAMSEINQVLSETEAPRVVEKKKLTGIKLLSINVSK